MKTKWKAVICALVIAASAAACGGASDHQEVQQAVSDSTGSAADSIVDAVTLLESSDLFADYGPQECPPTVPGEEEDPYCTPYEPDSQQVEAGYEELHDIMAERVFTEDNVEDTDSGKVTYLLRGDVVCDSDDFARPDHYDACVNDIEALEIRLRAEFDGDDRLALDVLLGPDEIHPLTLVFAPDEVSATVILDNVEAAADYVAGVFGEELGTFPERLEGVVEVGYYLDGDLARFAAHIHEDLGLEVDGYESFELDVEGVGEVFSVGVDTAEELLVGSVSLGALSFDGEVPSRGDEIHYDEQGESEQDGAHRTGLEMAGLTGKVTFDPDTERVDWSGLGLGGGPLVVSINGEEVVDIDLSTGAGGVFDAAMQLEEAGLAVDVEPGFELVIGTYFHRVAESYDDYDDWMLDEVLSAVLDGDDNPAVLIRDEGLEVVRGHLSLASDSTDHGAEVEAGMCLLDGEDSYEEDWDHPFEDLEAGQCEM